MSLARILVAGLATTMLSSVALANDDYYRCNDHNCYDDQADVTRELNLRQLENPGAGLDAVPPPGYMDEQGSPYDEAPDQDDSYGPPPDDRNGYGPPDDMDDQDGPPPGYGEDADEPYPSDDR
jgi:hypothetical protein